MQNQNTPDMDTLVENISQQVIEKLTEQITSQIEEQIEPLKETIKTEITIETKEKTTQDTNDSSDNSYKTVGQSEKTTKEEGKYRLPHLDNRPETSIILLNWIEFLMEKVGRNNLVDVLDYYVEIGWISEEVSMKMFTYADGIDYYVEKPTWKLLPEDHTKSLMFIEQLRGNKIDKSAFSRLEREIDRVKHSMETLYGI
jgi:flagellar protein FlaD